ERLLLQLEQLVLRELPGGNGRMMARRRVAGPVAEIEDRALPEQLVGLLLLAPGERLLQALEHPAPRRAGRVEGAALDERLERALVDGLRVDALGEVPDRRERPTVLAGAHDRAAGGLADVLHGVEAEADLPLDDGEVDLRRVHVGRQHVAEDRKSTRLNSSHRTISYAVFCLKKKKKT